MKFILASQSPRRLDLLRTMGIEPIVCPTDADETVEEKLKVEDFVTLLAKRKADAYKEELKNDEILIAADTVVAIGDKILGKPKDYYDAFEMISLLSGKTHSVFTGITVKTKDKTISTFDETKVTFKTLARCDIVTYSHSREPYDKAGAYAIQGKAGEFVEKTEGSLNNVIGLPTEKLSEILKNEFSVEV